MLLKDFKYYFIITLVSVIILYFLSSFFVIGYDEGMNTTKIALVSGKIMDCLVFSLEFWAEKLNFHALFAILMAFSTTSFIISIVIKITKVIWTKGICNLLYILPPMLSLLINLNAK